MGVVVQRLALLPLLASGAWVSACGRNLGLNSRQPLTAADIRQSYFVNIFPNGETGTGGSQYMASADYVGAADVGTAAGTSALPTGDSVTVNSVPMVDSSSTGNYQVTGTGDVSSFAFVWTDGGTAYKNTLSANIYPPSSVPTSVSKATGVSISVLGVPAGVAVFGSLSTVTQGTPPVTSGVPVEVTGGGTSGSSSANFSGLSPGPGVLTISETQNSGLQAATAAGGNESATVQYVYSVTITN